MDPAGSFNKNLLAPCGINCGTCLAFLREKNKCFGCLTDFENKRKSCNQCSIKNCVHLAKTPSKFCYECEIFPCKRLKDIDKRYKTKYRTGLIQNLLTIKENGISNYLRSEVKRWTCPSCGSITSVHSNFCLHCKHELN
jgi:hypothetical protein